MPALLQSDPAPCIPLVPGQLAREAVEVVETIHKLVLKSAESELSELLQTTVKITFGRAMQGTFSDALSDDSAGDRPIALDLSPAPGCGVLTIPLPLLFRVLDILLATPPDTIEDPERRVTGIELFILREFFDVFSRALGSAWKPYSPVSFMQIAPPDDEVKLRAAATSGDPALILSATIELGGSSSEVRLIVPPLLARLADLNSRSQAEQPAGPMSQTILNCLGDARLSIDAVLKGAGIRVRDLLELTPGRILTVASCGDSTFECLVNGNSRFTGDLVPNNGRYGIRIAHVAGIGADS